MKTSEDYKYEEIISILNKIKENNQGKFTKYKCIMVFLNLHQDWVSIPLFKVKYRSLFNENFSLTYLENLYLKYKIIDTKPKLNYVNFFKIGSNVEYKLLYKTAIKKNLEIIRPNIKNTRRNNKNAKTKKK